MNFGAEQQFSAAMSPYLSGTSSPISGFQPGFQGQQGQPQLTQHQQQQQQLAHQLAQQHQQPLQGLQQGQQQPQTPSAYQASALAYANAQLSQYAAQAASSSPQATHQQQQGQPQSQQQQQQQSAFANFFGQPGTALPAHLNPHALSQALAEYNSPIGGSMPNSAASSPGQTHKRLPASGFASGTATGASTPGGNIGGNSRVAASAITGKRLNWSEMICQTIAESESGRLVIQDLFEGMCSKFPEIREWAFGKDWEARVKNRIKSTLSIKGNLFIKVPRPSSAAGKGSWWTLSQEAQDAWKEGRVASVVKAAAAAANGERASPAGGAGAGHYRSNSAASGRTHDGLGPLSTATSRANSRAPSRRGSPVSSRGPSSQHANHVSTPSQPYINFGQQQLQQQQSQPSQQQQYQQHQTNLGYHSDQGASPGAGSGGGGSGGSRQSPSSGQLPIGLGMSPINFHSQPPSSHNSFDGMGMSLPGLDGTGGLEDFVSAAGGGGNNNSGGMGGMGGMGGGGGIGGMQGGGQINGGGVQSRMNEFGGNVSSDSTARRMRMMENSVNDGFDPSLGIPATSSSSAASLSMAPGASGIQSIYDLSFTSLGGPSSQPLGAAQSVAHLGGPQSMPFPPTANNFASTSGNGSGGPSSASNASSSSSSGDASAGGGGGGQQPNYYQHFVPTSGAGGGAGSYAFNNEPFAGYQDPFGSGGQHNSSSNAQMNAGGGGNGGGGRGDGGSGGLDLSSMPNPFGSGLAGGYTMLDQALPTNIPGRSQGSQGGGQSGRSGQQGQNRESGGGSAGGSGSGGRGTPSAGLSSSLTGASPADSTSAFFAYTPAMMAADAAAAAGGGSESALGPVGGEGSRKKREQQQQQQQQSSTSTHTQQGSGDGSGNASDFQLPPPASGYKDEDRKDDGKR